MTNEGKGDEMPADDAATTSTETSTETSTNRWTRLLRGDKLSTGFFCFIANEKIIEIAGYAGIDFVIFDTEHASYDVEFIEKGARVAEGAGLVTVVRMPGDNPDPHMIARVLDAGVDGLMFARVTTRESVEHLVKLCQIEPTGLRGSCPGSRAGHYALMPLDEYRRRSNDVAITVMIETKEALEQAEEIMKIPAVTGITVGRDDLASALGAKGGRNDPAVLEEERKILALAKKHNVGVRGSARNMEELKRYLEQENCPRVFSFLTDSYQIGSRFRELVVGSRELLGEAGVI